MPLFRSPILTDGWVATDRTRRRAQLASVASHPRLLASRAVARRRGHRETPVPSGRNEILERLATLPVSVWTYGWDHRSVRHLGPMAQDFAAAFGLGDSDRRIDMVDANGVVMAACQALHRRVVELEREVELLSADRAASSPPIAG